MRWNCILLAILHKNQKVKCLRRGNQNTTIWEFNKVGWTLFWAFFATMFAYCQSREVAPCCKIYKKFTIFSAFAPCKGGFFYCMHRESSILIMDSLKDEMEVLFILCLTPMQVDFVRLVLAHGEYTASASQPVFRGWASSMRFVAFYDAVYRNRQSSAANNWLSRLQAIWQSGQRHTCHGKTVICGTDAAHA